MGGTGSLGFVVFGVFRDADNLELRIQLPGHSEMPANGVPLKISPREGFIHHDDVTAAIVVLLGNWPAALDCRPNGLEIVRTDRQPGRLVPIVARRRIGLSGDEDAVTPIVKSHGSIQRIADRLDTGNAGPAARADAGKTRPGPRV